MTDEPRDRLALTRSIDAGRELIWQHCSTPEGMAMWQADEASGDMQLGDKLTLAWKAFGASAELEIIDRVEGKRIVLASPDSSVTIEVADGQVHLTQEGPILEGELEGLTASWNLALAQLAHCIENHPGESRRVVWAVRELPTTAENAYFFFTDAQAMGLWLGRGQGIGAEHSGYSLDLATGHSLQGRVLVNTTGRDVLLSVANHDQATLALRTLPSPKSDQNRLLALAWSEWGLPSDVSLKIWQEFDGCLDTLERMLRGQGVA